MLSHLLVSNVIYNKNVNGATEVTVVPFGPKQMCFPTLLRMFISFPVFIDRKPGSPHLPSKP